MSGITSTDRQEAWNIMILQSLSTDEFRAGAFQLWQQPFLCWRDLFNDLIWCFDLRSHLEPTAGELVLWVINTNDVVVHGLTMPYVPYSTESENDKSNVLSKFITVGTVSGNLDEDPLHTKLHLALCQHDIRDCHCEQFSLDSHLRSGIAWVVIITVVHRLTFG